MSRKQLPYMQFYVGDYMGDTTHLRTIEHGAYDLILWSYWLRQQPPKESHLARIAKMDEQSWLEIRETIAEFFDVTDGVWRHKRIELEIMRIQEKQENFIAGRRKRPFRAVGSKGRPRGKAWNMLRAVVFDRDSYVCSYCGVYCDKPHCDHVIPLCRGGSNEIENLATACPSCNMSKNDKTLEEWGVGQ